MAAVLFCIPVYVGASRLYEGEHYPSDVLAGALLGGLWLFCLLRTVPPGAGARRAERRQAVPVSR
jgi:undecaprenyl-diphosphatase